MSIVSDFMWVPKEKVIDIFKSNWLEVYHTSTKIKRVCWYCNEDVYISPSKTHNSNGNEKQLFFCNNTCRIRFNWEVLFR